MIEADKLQFGLRKNHVEGLYNMMRTCIILRRFLQADLSRTNFRPNYVEHLIDAEGSFCAGLGPSLVNKDFCPEG